MKYQEGDEIMRIIFKILAAPLVVILTVLVAVFTFLFAFSQQVLNIACGIAVLIGAALMVLHRDWIGGGVFLGIGFLVSPVGLPAIAEWLIDKLNDLNYFLRDFITS